MLSIAEIIQIEKSRVGRRQRWHTVHGTRKDAERELRQLLHSVETGSYVKPQRLNMGEFLHRWLNDYVKINCSPRTFDSYQCIVTCHLIPALGAIPLCYLHPHHIQQCYAHALSEGHANGKGGLSTQTVLHIHRVLFQALRYAVRQGLLIRNIAVGRCPAG